MKRQISFAVSATLVVAVLLAGCGLPRLGSSRSNAVGVPEPLQMMEEAPEDIIDYAPAGDWSRIAADIQSMTEAWTMYQPQATADGVSEATQAALSSTLARIEAAAAAKDAAATMQAANDASAVVIQMFALYNPTVPADIGQLDVLERQVILDVAAKDLAAATTSLAKAKAVWAKIKPSVLSHNGQDAAAQFEASLATQETALQAKDAAAVTAEAKNGLELVDVLENVYKS